MRLFVSALFIFTAWTARASDKTDAQYWLEAGLSTNLLFKNEFLSLKTCHQNADEFSGCAAALEELATIGRQPLRFIPVTLKATDLLEVRDVILDLGAFALVRVHNESESHFSPKESAAREKSLRRLVRDHVKALYDSGQRPDFRVFFEAVAPIAFNHPAPYAAEQDPAQDALLAANMYSSYYSRSTKDPHAYLEPVQKDGDLGSGSDPSFVGIGAKIERIRGKNIITAFLDGSPAAKSGLAVGDEVLSVDGSDVTKLSAVAVIYKLRGPAQSTAALTVRHGTEMLPFRIPRVSLTIANVTSEVVTALGPPYGRITIGQFSDGRACTKVSEALTALALQHVQGFIIDLRHNPGGLLEQASCIAGFFLGRTVVVQIKELETGRMTPKYSMTSLRTDLPMVVLIDAGSASASEILAGALQDNARAWIVGERSFGKGTAQASDSFPLRPSSVKLYTTVDRFYLPTGRTNQISGIIPDFEIPARPELSEDQRFVVREEDLYPDALEAEGLPWRQPRPESVVRIDDCARSFDTVHRQYKTTPASRAADDYPLFAAQEVLKCAN